MQNLFQKLRKAYKALLFIALTTFAIVLFQNCSSRLSSSSSDANSTPINNDENSSESLGPIRTTPNLPTQRIRFKKLVSSNGYGSRCGISMNDLLFCEASQGVYGARTKGFKEVLNLGAVKKVALGGGFGCAITMDDLVKCWGLNTVAQLGSGSKSMDAYPPIYYPAQEIASLAGAKDISASQSSACAVTARNKVFCWGESLTDLGGILTPQEVVLPNFDQTVAKVFLDGPAPRGLLLTTDGKLFFSGNITLA